MSYCPQCQYEYHPTVHLCPDCGVPLVLPSSEETPSVNDKSSGTEDWPPGGSHWVHEARSLAWQMRWGGLLLFLFYTIAGLPGAFITWVYLQRWPREYFSPPLLWHLLQDPLWAMGRLWDILLLRDLRNVVRLVDISSGTLASGSGIIVGLLSFLFFGLFLWPHLKEFPSFARRLFRLSLFLLPILSFLSFILYLWDYHFLTTILTFWSPLRSRIRFSYLILHFFLDLLIWPWVASVVFVSGKRVLCKEKLSLIEIFIEGAQHLKPFFLLGLILNLINLPANIYSLATYRATWTTLMSWFPSLLRLLPGVLWILFFTLPAHIVLRRFSLMEAVEETLVEWTRNPSRKAEIMINVILIQFFFYLVKDLLLPDRGLLWFLSQGAVSAFLAVWTVSLSLSACQDMRKQLFVSMPLWSD